MKKLFILSLSISLFQSLRQNLLNIQSVRRTTVQNEATIQSLSPSQDNGIIGSWSLVMQAFDENSNGKLDDEERKKGSTGRHFYQFKADGTCLIHTLKLNGSYKLKKEAGRERLYTYIDDGGTHTRENAWYVISVSKTELILLSQDKYAFWIYKRV